MTVPGGPLTEPPEGASPGRDMKETTDVRLLTADDVAGWLSVSARCVRRWAQDGTLPCVRLAGTTVRFDPGAIRQWVDEQRQEARAS